MGGGGDGGGAAFDKVVAKLLKKGKVLHCDFRGTPSATGGKYLCLKGAAQTAGGKEEED